MTPLRSVLGLLWLAGASAWMLPIHGAVLYVFPVEPRRLRRSETPRF